MRSRDLLRAVCLYCIAATTVGVAAQKPQFVAHVLDVSGEWHVDGKAERVSAGVGLTAGAKIVPTAGKAGDAITIVQDENLSRLRIVCDASATNPCLKAIVVQGSAGGEASMGSQLRGLVQTALGVLLDRPPAVASHYALTLTRGKESVRESEEVVALDPDEGLVLPAAPADMPAGKYAFSISPAGVASGAKEQVGVLTSEGSWRPLPAMPAGLYAISIADEDGEQVGDMMVLVVPAGQYAAMRASFDAIKSGTATWTGPNAAADQHLFLRAFLLSESHSL